MCRRSLFLTTSFLLSSMLLRAQTSDSLLARGVDISFTPQIEDVGGVYTVNGIPKNVLDIFKDNGVNYVRLRIWHTPIGGYCGTANTLAFAQRIKAKGFKFLLDFHYSDTWADPGKQNKPAAWASLPYTALRESVYAYTKNVLTALKNQNTLPDMVQIGNEITSGMLWPDGKVGSVPDPVQAWVRLGELVKDGIRGARDAAGSSPLKIMIHIDRGGDNAGARWFYDNLLAQGVQFDVIGLSYYPWWHGTLTQLKNNLNDLSSRYNKDIIVVETAYPWTTQSLNDGHGNVGVNPALLPPGYSISPQGQKAFLFTLKNIIKETTNHRGIGFFYWEPGYISVQPIGSSWEHLTIFTFPGEGLTSLTSFKNLDSLQTVNVKLRVNTATNWDTLKSGGFVQVRGEIVGTGSGLLPGGQLLTWDSYSRVVPRNVGGDYWECQFNMYTSDQIDFKLWSGHDSTRATYQRLGWEGPITPFDSSNRNARTFIAGTNDTTLELQFYNSKGSYVHQYWSLIESKQDSIAVLFRVNLALAMQRGEFNPDVHGPLAVRGDSAASAGMLSWSRSQVVLQRESLSIANGSFWSAVKYFPKAVISRGTPINFKFFAENSSFGGWEFNISNRVFLFPEKDTTLVWRFFNERNIIVSAGENAPTLPSEMRLYQNYPNPFNPATAIRYSILDRSHVRLSVFNVLGQSVRTLVEEIQEPGEHVTTWNGDDNAGNIAASGLYLLRLETEGNIRTRKILFLK